MSTRATSDRAAPRLLFSGYYGLGNAGDEAVLAGLLRGLREEGLAARITVLSANPAATEAWHGVRAVPRMRPAMLRAIWGCDILVSGGGSLLQDVTSVASLRYYLGVIQLAKLAGKPVAVAAQGMGPLLRPRSRQWVASSLNRVDLLAVRDAASAQLLRECGVTRSIQITADPAFLLGEEWTSGEVERARERMAPGGGPTVALALRDWPERDAAGWGVALCEALLRRGATPLLLPMHEPSDRYLAERLLQTVAERLPDAPPLSLLPPPKSLEDLLAGIAGCDALIGMRLHALLLAANAGVPVVAWSYDPKVDALMSRLNAEERSLPVDADPSQAAEMALTAIAHASGGSERSASETVEGLRREARRTVELLAELVRQHSGQSR